MKMDQKLKMDQKWPENSFKSESKWTEMFLAWNSSSVTFQPQIKWFWVLFSLIFDQIQSYLDSISNTVLPKFTINMPDNMYMGNWYKWVFESVSAVTYFLSDFIFSPWCWLWEGIAHFMGLWVLFWVPKLSPNRIYMFSLPDSNLG